jgi:hypothetical protein
MKLITVNIRVLGPSDELLDEIVVDMPDNITAGGLVGSLQRQHILPDSPEVSFTVSTDIPGDAHRRLSGGELQENDTIVIRQTLPEVRIRHRKGSEGQD